MVELENLGLVELDSQEVQDVEGGIWPIIIAALLYTSTAR